MSRLLFVNNTSKLGAGTSQSLLLLLRHLRQHYDSTVVLDDCTGNLPGEVMRQGARCCVLPVRTWRYLPSLVLLIMSRRVDLIYANNFSGRAENAAWAARFTRRPFIWHIRESLSFDSPIRFLGSAEALIANSADTARRLMEVAPQLSERIVEIPNGIELERFNGEPAGVRKHIRNLHGIPDGGLIVLNVGRICEQKNQVDALSAFAGISSRFPQAYLVFVGPLQEAPYVAELEKEARAREIWDRIRLVGLQEDVSTYVRAADVLVHTSRKESQGRVILEAMAGRLPVVAFDVGGIREAVSDQETGYLLPFGDIGGLSRALGHLIENAQIRGAMGARGYARVQREFLASDTAENVRRIIESTLMKVRREGLSDFITKSGSPRC